MAALLDRHDDGTAIFAGGTAKSAHRRKHRDGCPTTVVTLFDDSHPRAAANVGALERLPHLVERVCLLWGSADFEAYVNSLIMDSRDGKRQGLPWEVAQEMLFLIELSMVKRALRASEVTGVPFREMFARCLATADEAAQSSTPGARAVRADPWADPRARTDAGRRDSVRRPQPAPARNASAPAKPRWWQLLG